MRNFYYLLTVLAVASFTKTYGQDFTIQGRLTDSTQSPLQSATVYVEKAKDSSLVEYTISKSDGRFLLESKTSAEEVIFSVTFSGFTAITKELDLSQQSEYDFGDMEMQPAENELDEITITGRSAPVSVKTDTLEFNASSFKTREDAKLEDVLKELPGVTVDTDGNIKVNGKSVSSIKVNNKEFFGDDPKIALKNLPKELINKIQVVDDKTKSQEFTGEESDSEDKAINLTIDEDKNRGLFARATAGGGTDDRYALSGIGNYFKEDLRLTVLASSNNINSSGFTYDEVFDAMGRNAYAVTSNLSGSFRGSGGSGSGVTKSDNAGLNFVNDWNDKADVEASYFFNRADTRRKTDVRRENILPDRTYVTNSSSKSENKNDNHRFNSEFSFEPDTLTRISVKPKVTTNDGYSTSNTTTKSTAENGDPINEASTQNQAKNSSLDFGNEINFRRKFGDDGGFFGVEFGNQNNTSEEDQYYFTQREIFDDNGELENTEVQDQYIDNDSRLDEYNIGVNFRYPFTEHFLLDVDYDYTSRDQKNKRLVYEKDDNGNYENLNEDLSNNFKSESYNHRPSLGFVFKNKKFYANVSGGFQSVRLKNKDLFTDNSFDNTYENFFANARFRYRVTQAKSLYFRYRNSREIPSISQLQPVTNTTNPLNIITGNPDLKPSLEHSVYMNFNNYDFRTRSGFYIYAKGDYTLDKVTSKTTTDEDLVQTTSYTNVDGAYDASVGGFWNKRNELDERNSLRYDLGVRFKYAKNIGFSNGVKFNSKRFSVGPQVKLKYELEDYILLEPNYSLDYVRNKYSLNGRNEEYTNHSVGFQVTSFWPENVIFGSDLKYKHIGSVAPGIKNDYVLWNLSLGYKVFGDDGNVKLKVFDVLDENLSTQRQVGNNFVQDTRQLVLEQYMMLSFTYKLSRFGGLKKKKGRGRH